MRREQIFKICLNHALTHDIEYKPKDSKSWHFVVNDYSDGEVELEQFCLRFKNEEIAGEFKKSIDDALNGVTSKQNGTSEHADKIPQRISAADKQTAEEKENIKKLQLPQNFYDYKNVEQCSGCRGCHSEEFKFPEIKVVNQEFIDDNPLPLVMPKTTKSNDLSKKGQTTTASTTTSFNFFSNTPAFGTTATSNSFVFGTPTAGDTKPVVAQQTPDSVENAIKPSTFSFTSALAGTNTPKTEATSTFSFSTGNNAFGSPTVTTQSEPIKTSFSFNSPAVTQQSTTSKLSS